MVYKDASMVRNSIKGRDRDLFTSSFANVDV